MIFYLRLNNYLLYIMPLFNNNLLFIHIPKTGGTYLENKLKNYETGDNFGYDNQTLTYKQHYTYNNYLKIYGNEKIKSFEIFTIIRNPYDRLFSAYKQKFKNTSDKNLIIMMESNDFRDFVLNKLENLINNREKQKYKGNISHILPQINFVENYNIKKIKYENLENLNKYLKDRGIDTEIKFTNISETYLSEYDYDMKIKIQEIYKEDFNLYNSSE